MVKTYHQTDSSKEEKREQYLKAEYAMLYLTACGLHGIKPDIAAVRAMDLEAVYAISHQQSLSAITFTALALTEDENLHHTPIFLRWQEAKNKAIAKNALLDIERTKLCAFLDEKQIWYLPLKGIVLKTFYPKPEMRQMADNDILFDAAYEQTVHDYFTAQGYTSKSYGVSHHDIYQKPPILNFEMHTDLFYKTHDPVWDTYYSDIKSRLLCDHHYAYRFRDEDFYIYLITHMYKHYSFGGIGVRSLLDCYVYNRVKGTALDWCYVECELEKLGILTFEKKMRQLAWNVFSCPDNPSFSKLLPEEQDALTYFFASGTYGSVTHRVQNDLKKINGQSSQVPIMVRLSYIITRFFPDPAFMRVWCNCYCPFLKLHPKLFFLAYPYRILTKGFKNMRQYIKECHIIMKIK
ncbi:MAG: nucleotidyltransferase family protein [Clostridia bacterium]|nr:nucleotidyltransferase family protein [Clostridia bacterium]